MILTIKHKLSYYKKFRSDIWGLCILNSYADDVNYKGPPRVVYYKKVVNFFERVSLAKQAYKQSLLRRFSYRLDIVAPRRKIRYLKKRFVSLRVVKLFYLTLTYKHFKRIGRLAKKKDGLFEQQFCLLLEGRLISFLYRTSFVTNMFESLYLVKRSFILLDRQPVNFVNMPVKLFQILSFAPSIKIKMYFDYAYQLLYYKRTLNRPPRYMFISYWFLFAYMRKLPYREQLSFPAPIDIYRATGFAF
jgi:ribosomal protein S4